MNLMKSYYALINLLDGFQSSINKILKENQLLLQGVLTAAKLNESSLNDYLVTNLDKLSDTRFQIYLDGEIKSKPPNSSFRNILTTIKLRIIDEEGKKLV